MARGAWPLLVGALLACSTDEASVIEASVSEGEPRLGVTLELVRVTVTRLEGGAAEGRVTEVVAVYEGGRLRPVVVALRPERESDVGRTLYRVRAEGLAGGRVIVTVQHRVAFVAARTVTLPLRFEGSCVDVPCGGDRTCAGGGCVDDFVPECVLLGRDDPACADDAGPPDRPDLGDTLDAGDAEPADLGPPDAGPDPQDLGLVPIDTGPRDMGEEPVDLGPEPADTGPHDMGTDREDLGPADLGPMDPPDLGPPDLGPPDLGPPDLGPPPDAGPCPTGCGVNESCGPTGCRCNAGFQSCDGMPGCESNMANDPAHCGSCAVACSGATPNCVGGACVACASAADCNDGLSCTTDACMGGSCQHTATGTGCFIDGACRASGATNGPCQTCNPAVSQTAWTPRANGTSCNDGMFCTLTDSCQDGVCLGTGTPCGEPQSYRCVPSCNEATDSCTATFGGAATWCYIDNGCIHESWDYQHPTNQCLGCEPSIDRFNWSPRQDGGVGEGCNDGLFCTLTDRCTLTASPSCVGTGATCDDGLSCTTDGCNESSNRCTNTISTGCLIGGVCYASGTRNPANDCQQCTTATSTTSWTNRIDGQVCGGGFSSCCGGVCHPCSDADCACMACTGGQYCSEFGAARRCVCTF